MSITTVGITHGNKSAASADVDFVKPTGVLPGDLLVCVAGLGFGGGAQSWTPPPGFTDYFDILETALSITGPFFYKIADGSEAATLTATSAIAGQGGFGCCAYRGVHQVAPLLAVSPVTDDTGGTHSTTVQAASWAGAADAISMILIINQKLTTDPTATFPAGWDATGVDGFIDNDGVIWCQFGVNLTTNPAVTSLPSQTVPLAGLTIDANAQFAVQAAAAAPSTDLQLELGPIARRFA